MLKGPLPPSFQPFVLQALVTFRDLRRRRDRDVGRLADRNLEPAGPRGDGRSPPPWSPDRDQVKDDNDSEQLARRRRGNIPSKARPARTNVSHPEWCEVAQDQGTDPQ